MYYWHRAKWQIFFKFTNVTNPIYIITLLHFCKEPVLFYQWCNIFQNIVRLNLAYISVCTSILDCAMALLVLAF
jgi:hypothetical protein